MIFPDDKSEAAIKGILHVAYDLLDTLITNKECLPI